MPMPEDTAEPAPAAPTAGQRRWLRRGLDQPGGKLPLFDAQGQRVGARLVRSCIAAGWAEPWFNNPLKPDWLVCRLTEAGRKAAAGDDLPPLRREAAAPPAPAQATLRQG